MSPIIYQSLCVFAGAGSGGLCRYLVSLWISRPQLTFPWATLTVNLVGSLIIGVGAAWLATKPNDNHEIWRLLLIVGFLGGFTTFSSFSKESLELLRDGQLSMAAAYILISNIGGLLLAWAGWATWKTCA